MKITKAMQALITKCVKQFMRSGLKPDFITREYTMRVFAHGWYNGQDSATVANAHFKFEDADEFAILCIERYRVLQEFSRWS